MTGDGFPIEVRNLDPVRRAALIVASLLVVETFRLARGSKVRFGRGVVANHRLSIRGPGMVTVGDGANLYAFAGRTRLVARTPQSVIRIGANARLNGPLVQADSMVEIGPECIVGQAHLLDTDMHSLRLDRRQNPSALVRTAPVVLERNVWVARGAAILPGVRVGEGSVVGYGAIVTSDVPPRSVVAGNPARVIGTVE